MRLFGSKIFVAATILLVAATFQCLPKRRACYFTPNKPLIDYLPLPIDGWVSTNLPLGETELLSAKTQQVLQLSDYAHRSYTKNNKVISVYCAYWGPGTQSIAEAGLHNPDVCWVEAGWQLVGAQREIKLSVTGQDALPGQYRCYRSLGGTQYVVFWHVSAGRLTGYAMGATENWSKRLPYIWRNFTEMAFGMSVSEQVLVRISCNIPIEDIAEDALFKEIMASVSRFGLISTS